MPRVRLFTFALMLAVATAACGEGGGSPGDSGPSAASQESDFAANGLPTAPEPIFAGGADADAEAVQTSAAGIIPSAAPNLPARLLPPGATRAYIAWGASYGPVSSYLVFVSRNRGDYLFSQVAARPNARVEGRPGDRVQVAVLAVTASGEVSEASAASAPFYFLASQSSGVTQVGSTAAPSAPEVTNAEAQMLAQLDPLTEAVAQSIAEVTGAEEIAEPTDLTDLDETELAEEANSELSRTIREMLLRGDARLPESGLSDSARVWLEEQIDDELTAGVSLAGTGRQDDDRLSDVVWQDPAGQLFVSNGQEMLDGEDLPNTFAEGRLNGLRLDTTERFAGLADFDGDGQGDWLIEDAATGEVWVVDGATQQPTAMPTESSDYTYPVNDDGENELAGHGDFDGDGLSELLWRSEGQGFHVTLAANEELNEAPFIDELAEEIDPLPGLESPPDGFALLAIADLNGDGRDDLLGTDAAGTLVIALAQPSTDAHLSVEWQPGASDSTQGLELLATVDLDDDGAAEIAFLNGDVVEIWDPESGPREGFSL